MLSKLTLVVALVFSAAPAFAQTQLTGHAVPGSGFPVIIDVDYKGSRPDKGSPYLDRQNWKIRWSNAPDADAISVHVDTVTVGSNTDKISLQVSGELPPTENIRGVYWTVLFNPTDAVPLLPQLASSTPSRRNQPTPPKPDCSNNDPSMQPSFCPVPSLGTPDFSLTGSFLTAGGTKPIIAAELKTDLVLSRNWEWLGFYPEIKTAVEINQDVHPPNNRTRFDPDSIIAGLSFYKAVPNDRIPLLSSIKNSPLFGIKLEVQLPEGEFNRADPSSNIIVGGLTKLVFKPLQAGSFYATLYPVLGLEAGRNLNSPSEVDKTPVDFSHYKGIVRGILGTDAAMGVASNDRKSDIFSITASYRVRLPAMDEPFIKTIHQVTTIDLNTKARHWVEVDINSSPWAWKYFALNAKYQYGELPPLFSLVDHKFSIGFTLQAVQTSKPAF
jgi:hypothetical protein